MPATSLCLLPSLFLICSSLLPEAVTASNVLELTNSNFDDVMAPIEIALVKFYIPGCLYCEKLAPSFEEAAAILKSNEDPVSLVGVDCSVQGELCARHDVTGYPRLGVFKHGQFAYQFEGGRNTRGIVDYMAMKAAPNSRELFTVPQWTNYLASFPPTTPVVIGYFENARSELYQQFASAAAILREDFKFGHTFQNSISQEAGFVEDVVIYYPIVHHSKFEPTRRSFQGSEGALEGWIRENYFGLAGVRHYFNSKFFFQRPLVVAYFPVDYEHNVKQTNYWRNRLLKVVQQVKEQRQQQPQASLHLAITNSLDTGELHAAGVEQVDKDTVYIAAYDKEERKYFMEDTFSLEKLELWLNQFLNGEIPVFIKSEPIPEESGNHQEEPVKVIVGKTFDAVVLDPTKDVLVQFHSVWSTESKEFEPTYANLARKLSAEKDLVIGKIEAMKNDVPERLEINKHPTFYFFPKHRKQGVKFEGDLDQSELIEFIAELSTEPLQGYDRDGNVIRSDL